MNFVPFIEHKRDGGEHPPEALDALIAGVVDGSIPEYQLSAWLMAVVLRGMTDAETAALTISMARSGRVLDLSDLPGPVVDKHSTGGVGDKTSLIVGPLAAATGLTVAKMSGRGLGHTGGTLDKLESISGLGVMMTTEAFKRQAKEVGLVIAGQTSDLAPADGRLYALRDVTGTVPSLPLIAASIMSKKIAAGAGAIALDVKVGNGAFMKDLDGARSLAETMVTLGKNAGRRVAAVLTTMDAPLGRAIGNSLEVKEALDTMRGAGPPDLEALCLEVAGLMHVVAGTAVSVAEVRPRLKRALDSGEALAAFRAMVVAQGGDPEEVDSPERLPHAPIVRPVVASHAGWIESIDALAVGVATVALGAGRRTKDESVDHAVGVVLSRGVGSEVQTGDDLALVHARTEEACDAALLSIRDAVHVSPEKPRVTEHSPSSPVIDTIGV